jgi:hypothetical protein
MTSPLRSCGLGNSDVAFLMPCLGIVENLTDAVDWSLYDPDPPEGGGSGGSISIGSGAEGS